MRSRTCYCLCYLLDLNPFFLKKIGGLLVENKDLKLIGMD